MSEEAKMYTCCMCGKPTPNNSDRINKLRGED